MLIANCQLLTARLERDRRFAPYLEFAMLVHFRFGRYFPAGHGLYAIEDAFADLTDRSRSLENVTGGEIDVSGHAPKNIVVRGQLNHRGDGVADGRAAAGGKDHHGRAR